MKKIYSAPTVAAKEIITSDIIAGSVDISIGGDQETGTTDAAKHQWGNLWNK